MQSSTELILIECSEQMVSEIGSEIDKISDTQYKVIERKNLDGAAATWVIVATLSVQALPHILNFITARSRPELPTKIKIGDIEIENPTKEDIEWFRQVREDHINSENKDG